MKRTTILTLAAFAVLTLTLNGIADARRMGGGGNFGAQRSVPAQKPTTISMSRSITLRDAFASAVRRLSPIRDRELRRMGAKPHS